jgi:hypothetical protein
MIEYSARGVRLEERKELPPGVYEFKEDGTAVRVDSAYNVAAERFLETLRCLQST